jgi:ribosomal-protein-alanine N-acetyltransferase
MNADPVVMAHLERPLTADESDGFVAAIEAHFESHGFGLWAVEVDGGEPFIGFVGLWPPRFDGHFTPAIEIGWRLAKTHWGRGYATEAARAALQFGFEELDLQEIVSFTTPENVPSQRVMERIGMHHDPADDFDHPRFPPGHRLSRHVLFRLRRNASPAH